MKLFQLLSVALIISGLTSAHLNAKHQNQFEKPKKFQHHSSSESNCCDHVRGDLKEIKKDLDNIHERLKGTCTHMITECDVNPYGYIICEPGVYCLAEDITFSPCADGTSAIVINVASGVANVVLEMNGHTLSYNPSSEGTGITGILVNGQTNVVIRDGTVSGFDLYGIRFNSGSRAGLLTDMRVFDNGSVNGPYGGISIVNSSGMIVERSAIDHNYGIGLSLLGVDGGLVVDSSLSANRGALVPGLGGSICWGAFMTNLLPDSSNPCIDISFVNCTADDNTSDGVAIGIECIGVPTVHKNINLVNCTAQNNAGGATGAFTEEGEGFAIIGVANFVVKDCIAQGNHSNATEPSGIAGNHSSSGYSIAFLDTNGLLENCVAENNTGNGDISDGFRIMRGSNITVKNCVAIGNTNGGYNSTLGVYGEAWGFTSDPDIGNFLGFPQAVQCSFEGCQAINNISTASTPPTGTSGGFKFVSQVGSNLTGCLAQGNGVGVYVSDPACCSVGGPAGTCCCLEPGTCCPSTPPECQDTPGYACSHGACSSTTPCCPASQNNVISHSLAISNVQGGFYDNIPTANTAYYNNTARSNGPTGMLNYVGVITTPPSNCSSRGSAGNPIRLWIAPDAPCSMDNNGILDPLDNMDIRP